VVDSKPRSLPRVAAPEARSVTEAIVEPDLAIVDPHIHLFDDRTSNYTVDDLLHDTGSGHRVESVVFIECQWGWDLAASDPAYAPVGEMRRIAEAAEESRRRRGTTIGRVVGHADLRHGAGAGDVLDALADAVGGEFTGIRHGTTWDPSPLVKNHRTAPPRGLMSAPTFRAGYRELARRGLSFDAWLYHHQLGEALDLVRAEPDVPFIVDHLGGPLSVGPYAEQSTEVRAEWRAGLTRLRDRSNVVVKLGGIGFPLMIEPSTIMATRSPEQRARLRDDGNDPDATPPTSTELAAYWAEDIRWVIDQFGVERSMFESNFPIDRVMCSYRTLWNAFKRIVADASPDEKAALFRGTARRVYRFPGPEEALAGSVGTSQPTTITSEDGR